MAAPTTTKQMSVNNLTIDNKLLELKIKNKIGINFVKVSISLKNNKEIYNGPCTKVNDKKCTISINKPDKGNLPLTILFYDNRGKITSATIVSHYRGNKKHITLDSANLGVYVFDQFKKFKNVDGADLWTSMDNYFKKINPQNKNIDTFAVLGERYKKDVYDNKKSQEQFFNELNSQLQNNGH
jgi:hypothetical protein